jgi:hypothetical protein
MLTAVLAALIVVAGVLGVSPHQARAAAVPASKAFDTCFNCFGSDPDQAWFNTVHSDGYDLMIIDPVTWNSEFPNGNTNDPGPASGCQFAADSKQLINNAITSGMKVMVYNRNLNCEGTMSKLGPQEKHGTPVYIWDIENSPQLTPTSAQVANIAKLGFGEAVYTWNGGTSKSLTYLSKNYPLFFNEVSNWNGCSGENCGVPSDYPSINSIQPFDGWSSAVIEQQSTGQLNGMNVDYDSVSTSWLNSLR